MNMKLFELSLNDKFMMSDGCVVLTFHGMDGAFGKVTDSDNHFFYVGATEEVVKVEEKE